MNKNKDSYLNHTSKRTMTFELNLFSYIFNQESLLGRYTKYVIFTQFPVVAPESLRRQPQPCPSSGVAVIHEETALLIPESQINNLNNHESTLSQHDMKKCFGSGVECETFQLFQSGQCCGSSG